jgi:hypothetical protein
MEFVPEDITMNAIFVVILVGLVGAVVYHTSTYGRRGRRWGGF